MGRHAPGHAPTPSDELQRVQRELARTSGEVRILRDVSTQLNATLDLDEIYAVVLGTMDDLFGFHHALILQLEEASGSLRVVAGRGYADLRIGTEVALGVGIVGLVAARKRMMRIGNLRQKRTYYDTVRAEVVRAGGGARLEPLPALPGLDGAESQIAIPLLIKQRLIGVFSVETAERRVFDERDETLASIVANLAAIAMHNAILYRRATSELSVVKEIRAKEKPRHRFEDIVGASGVMCALRDLLKKVARSPASTVLVTGENGTGKDLVAKVIHDNGARAAAPFMNITCSALAENLLESELFGHDRGAFTDAKKDKRGLLELAHGGTVFLDEIGEMSTALQAKLLRFLEEKTFKRVGGSADIRVDVRVVAATNRDLPRMVREGSFREDLYYRLRVLPVELPPLRVRAGDVPLLLERFMRAFALELGKEVSGISAEAVALLERYDWPGNVRELRNAVERAVLLCEGTRLSREDFAGLVAGGAAVSASADDGFALPAAGLRFEEVERSLVVQALERSAGNQARAARLLGMPRDWVRYRVERYGLRRGSGTG